MARHYHGDTNIVSCYLNVQCVTVSLQCSSLTIMESGAVLCLLSIWAKPPSHLLPQIPTLSWPLSCHREPGLWPWTDC